VLRLMTHPGVGPITALAFVLIIGTPERFPCGKQIGSYIGLIPAEDSSAGRQRLGHISKQGNALLRYLLGEAAQAAVRCDADWRRRYMHLAMRREKNIAKVAMARRIAVRLYWMWRNGWEYGQSVEFGSAVAGGAFFAVFAKGAQCIRYHNALQTPQFRRWSSYGFYQYGEKNLRAPDREPRVFSGTENIECPVKIRTLQKAKDAAPVKA
jgi:hypothetical protein